MEPAQLRERVEIQVQTTTATTDLGHPYENWVTSATVWAKVQNLGGREAFYAKQVQPDATHRIVIRSGQTVAVASRLKVGSRIFNVLETRPDGEPDGYLEITVQEVL
jgi:SPP1 family predicted phage head-tail adaptor